MPTTYNDTLKSLKPIHIKIIHLHLKLMKNSEILKKLGVSEPTVSHTIKDPRSKKIIEKVLMDSLCVDSKMIV